MRKRLNGGRNREGRHGKLKRLEVKGSELYALLIKIEPGQQCNRRDRKEDGQTDMNISKVSGFGIFLFCSRSMFLFFLARGQVYMYKYVNTNLSRFQGRVQEYGVFVYLHSQSHHIYLYKPYSGAPPIFLCNI